MHRNVQEMGPDRYVKAFSLLKDFVDGSLDFFKVSLPGRFDFRHESCD